MNETGINFRIDTSSIPKAPSCQTNPVVISAKLTDNIDESIEKCGIDQISRNFRCSSKEAQGFINKVRLSAQKAAEEIRNNQIEIILSLPVAEFSGRYLVSDIRIVAIHKQKERSATFLYYYRKDISGLKNDIIELVRNIAA